MAEGSKRATTKKIIALGGPNRQVLVNANMMAVKLMLLGVWVAWSLSLAVARADPVPNILFIFSDDHAMRTISAYAGEAGVNRTPGIDRLAAAGAIFTRSMPRW